MVDDDQRLRALLERYLTENGYGVKTAPNAPAARKILESSPIDVMILDLMMPGESGLDLCRSIRDDKNLTYQQVPILMLTALGESQQRITGLEQGADDYLGKPFEPRELLLRIENLLKRGKTHTASTTTLPSILTFGPKSFDPKTQNLFQGTDVVYLTSAELMLLNILALEPFKTFSREDLADKCGVSLSPRTIDVQITRLRKKLEDDAKTPQYLRTIRHKGYALWPDQ